MSFLYFLAGVATGLIVALIAVYVQSKAAQITAHERGQAELILQIKEQSQLLHRTLNRSRSRYS